MAVYYEKETARQEAAQKERQRAARTAWIQLLKVRATVVEGEGGLTRAFHRQRQRIAVCCGCAQHGYSC